MVKKRSLKMQFSLTTLMAYSNETQVNHSLYIIPSEVTITVYLIGYCFYNLTQSFW